MTWPSPSMLVALAGLATAVGGQTVIGKDQVTSESVRDHSLLLADFKHSQRALITGAGGPPGKAGEPGPSARGRISVGTIRSQVATSPACIDPCGLVPPDLPAVATATVGCDPGEVAANGGVAMENTVVMDTAASHPTADGTGWTGTVANDDISGPHTFTVHVLCVRGQAMTFR